MSQIVDLTGARFGQTTVLGFAGYVYGRVIPKKRAKPRNIATWRCRCDCGTEHIARGTNLKTGNTLSCGCLHSGGRAIERHGHHDSPSYSTWEHMLQRSDGKMKGRHAHIYAHVTVCDRWRSFAAFLEDMGERPAGTSLDRIDPDKGYEPSNCRWATPKQQARNLRTTRRIEIGTESVALADLAEFLRVRPEALWRSMGAAG